MIKAITFDLDGVYFLHGKQRFFEELEKLGVSEEEARRVFFKSEEMNQQYKKGLWTDEQYWSWALEEWKLELSVEEVKALLIKGYEVNQEVEEVVKKVREKGYKTLVCTNNFPARIQGLQERFGFLDNFDVKVISYEVGVIKPQAEIFQKLIAESGVSAEEIFYADDSEEAVSVAKSLGITARLYTDFSGFMQELKDLGVELS